MKRLLPAALPAISLGFALTGAAQAQDPNALRAACISELSREADQAAFQALLDLCERAVVANPKSAELKSWLATAQLRGGEAERAHDTFRAAAEAGDLEAKKTLGLLYLRSPNGGEDLVQAVAWLRAVAEVGDSEAQNLVGTINVLCRMRIGNIPMTKEDEDIVRQLEIMWDRDKKPGAQNKVAIVSAMYL